MSKAASKPAKKKAEEPRPEFALVFYQSEKKTGVVNSLALSKSVRIGNTINAPQPFDHEGDPKISKATLIQFGHSVKFLKDVPVYLDENDKLIMNNNNAGEDEAESSSNKSKTDSRKRSMRLSKEEDEQRTKRTKEINASISAMPTLFKPKVTNQIPSANSDHPESVIGSQITCHGDDDVIQVQIAQPSKLSSSGTDTQSVKGTSENSNVSEGDTQSDQNQTPDNHSQSSTLGGGGLRVLPTRIGLQNTITLQTDHSNFNKPDVVVNSVPEGIPITAPHGADKENRSPIVLAGSRSQVFPTSIDPHENRVCIPNLECFTPHTDKMLLIETQPGVYIFKSDWINLPSVVPRMKNAPPKQRKPTEGPVGAVYPGDLVRKLVQLLIPNDKMLHLTGTTIPTAIYLAIKDYTNNRLGQKYRIGDPQFNSYITEYAKTLRKKYST